MTSDVTASDAASTTTLPTAAARSSVHFPRARVPSNAALVAGIGVVLVLVLLLLVADTLPVFVIGLIVAYLLDPVVTWAARRGVPRGLATLLSMVLLVATLVGLGAIFIDTVLVQAAAFAKQLPAAFADIRSWIDGLSVNEALKADLLRWLDSIAAWFTAFDYTRLISPLIGGLFTLLGSFFTLLVLPFFIFYVLAGRPTIQRSVDGVLPQPWRDDVNTLIWIALDSFGTYVRAEAIVAVILGIATWASLMALSIVAFPPFADFALLLGIIAAFSELIPNFGPWIAAIPAVLFALTVSPQAVVVTIVLYIVLMFLEGQILVPKIEGGAFSFHPALVLFIVVAGVALMGLLGAILSLPVTAMAWRSARYAFRRAAGLPAGRETALAGDLPAATEPDGTGTPAPATTG